MGLTTVVVLGLLLGLGHRRLLVHFAQLFRVDNAAPSDALVLLLGGDADRAQKTAALFRQGYGRLILLGSDPDTEINRRALLSEGVPAEVIRTLGPVQETHDEAVQVRAFARTHKLRQITVVTTAFHTRRACRTFHRVLNHDGIDVRMAASESDQFDESNWYRRPQGRTAYFRELAKSVYYWMIY